MDSPLDRITDWNGLAEQAGFRVQALAEILHRTPKGLRDYVRLRWNRSTKTWLAGLQMRVARHRLLAGERPKEIAQLVGFQHATHFSRAFRIAHGVSPRAFLIDQIKESSRKGSKLV